MLIGKGAAWADAGPALAKLVDLGIPYVTSPMARGTLPDDHPNFANAARSQALAGADVIVMFGGRFNWIFGLGRRFAPGAKIVQVDVEAEEAYLGREPRPPRSWPTPPSPPSSSAARSRAGKLRSARLELARGRCARPPRRTRPARRRRSPTTRSRSSPTGS